MIARLVYLAVVLTIAVATAYAVTALPFGDPRLGQPAAIVTGAAASLLVLAWQPHRKDNR